MFYPLFAIGALTALAGIACFNHAMLFGGLSLALLAIARFIKEASK